MSDRQGADAALTDPRGLPRELVAESRLGKSTLDGLRARGHEIVDAGAWALGRLSAVSKSDALLCAAANARGMQGYAAGR